MASSIVTGPFAKEHLPLRLRDTISFEAGANDGLAYLFVMLAVMMLGHGPDEALSRWVTESLLVGVLGATVIGCIVGYGAAKLLMIAERRGVIENTSLLGYTVAFSLFTLGAAKLLGAVSCAAGRSGVAGCQLRVFFAGYLIWSYLTWRRRTGAYDRALVA